MRVEVRNYGRDRAFPTHLGNIFCRGAGQVTYLNDLEAAQEIGAYPNVSLKILEKDGPAVQEEAQVIDYSLYPISELRSIAASLKIPGFFTMRKVDLIKKLQETNK